MPQIFRLYWLRESGCDTGTRLEAGELDPAIADRVSTLAREHEGEIDLRLPFFDRREWKLRASVLPSYQLVRQGGVIQCALDDTEATRDCAATLALTDARWKRAPGENGPRYFETWQKVSVHLQEALRLWIPQIYFRQAERYEDRDAAYSMLVYSVARAWYGRGRTEFTFDFGEPVTLNWACRSIGRAMQTALADVERRLEQEGKVELARRYAPRWHKDILAAVRKHPRRLLGLLADEAMLIDAVIDLGTAKTADAVNRLARAANSALRNVCGDDMRNLGVRVLEEATRVLAPKHALNCAAHFL